MIQHLRKYKKLMILGGTIFLIFLIYQINNDHKIRYVSLGDSLAAGQNPYGEVGYGYTDYVANYLNKNNLLKSYIKSYASSGYRTKDIRNDINYGKTVEIDKEQINIKKALREANLVTISIGANDFFEKLNLINNNSEIEDIEKIKAITDEIMLEVEETLKTIRRYAKGRIILVGYYNPFLNLYGTKEKEVDQVFTYIKNAYQKVCNKYQTDYIDIYELMKNKPEYLPNPTDIHPNTKGYETIATEIIRFLDKNI